jgi:hypothetical protein
MAKKTAKKKKPDLRELYMQAFRDKKRLPDDQEKLMASDPEFAYMYAKYLRKPAGLPNNGAWSEEEETIFFKSPKWAYMYSLFIRKSEAICRYMMANAIVDVEDDWTKRFFDFHTGVDKIREELEKVGK